MKIETIRNHFNKNKILYSKHAKYEMESDEFGEIRDQEVYEAIINGEIIEEYFDDKPYPSALIFGMTDAGKPIHIVCACDFDEEISIIITVYHPNPELWIEYKRRIEK